MMRGDYIFVAKWTLIVAGATGIPGMLVAFIAVHGGTATHVALTLMPSLWIFRERWIHIDSFVTMVFMAAALHVLIVFVIVLALNMVLRRRREPI